VRRARFSLWELYAESQVMQRTPAVSGDRFVNCSERNQAEEKCERWSAAVCTPTAPPDRARSDDPRPFCARTASCLGESRW